MEASPAATGGGPRWTVPLENQASPSRWRVVLGFFAVEMTTCVVPVRRAL